MLNQYGLDASYFKNKLKIILVGINSYTPHELARELTRLACTADADETYKEISRVYVMDDSDE